MIFVTDMIGGSPCNLSLKACRQGDRTLLSGANYADADQAGQIAQARYRASRRACSGKRDANISAVSPVFQKMAERILQIINEKGLHARASAKFSETVDAFDADAYVSKGGEEVTGESHHGSADASGRQGRCDHGAHQGCARPTHSPTPWRPLSRTRFRRRFLSRPTCKTGPTQKTARAPIFPPDHPDHVPYNKRDLSYAGTFTNPWKAFAISGRWNGRPARLSCCG